jgi:hypothetical protein
MSYEFLTTIVVINVIVTFILLQKVTDASRPRLKRREAKKLWRSEPIVPRHDPPKIADDDDSLRPADRLFFADFKGFADYLNWSLAAHESRFRLQDLPDQYIGIGGPLGRAFAIYYNQMRVGKIEIHSNYSRYSTQAPEVSTSVEIDWARFIGFYELKDFLGTIATYVTSKGPNSNEHIVTGLSTNSALTKTLWDHYQISQYDKKPGDHDFDWGKLEIEFEGTAKNYIDERDLPRMQPSAGGSGQMASNTRADVQESPGGGNCL